MAQHTLMMTPGVEQQTAIKLICRPTALTEEGKPSLNFNVTTPSISSMTEKDFLAEPVFT